MSIQFLLRHLTRHNSWTLKATIFGWLVNFTSCVGDGAVLIEGVSARCRMEYEQRDSAVRGDAEAQKKLHSFVLFLGELYLNLEVGRFLCQQTSGTLTLSVPAMKN